MSVLLSTVLYLVAAAFYFLAHLCEVVADLSRKLQLEITVEFLVIVCILVFRGNWGALALVITLSTIVFLEVGRRGAIGLGLPWYEADAP